MEADDSVGKVGVDTHAGRKTQRQVCEKTHAERSQGGDGSCGSYEVAVHFLLAQQVLCVGSAQI